MTMKCPQLSKPEEPKLHRWQNVEKTLEKPGSVGGAIPHITSLGADLLWLTGKCV